MFLTYMRGLVEHLLWFSPPTGLGVEYLGCGTKMVEVFRF
jgi:hypothetical protein